jgi:CheY-like chemotaxis protein
MSVNFWFIESLTADLPAPGYGATGYTDISISHVHDNFSVVETAGATTCIPLSCFDALAPPCSPPTCAVCDHLPDGFSARRVPDRLGFVVSRLLNAVIDALPQFMRTATRCGGAIERPRRGANHLWFAENRGWHHACSTPSFVPMKSEPQPDETKRHGNTFELKAILLVDDDKQLASALQWILADENFLVDVAFDGEQALLKVKVNEYDLIICDLMMPRLRGDDFYLKAREMRPALSDRFIFITSFGTDPKIHDFFTGHEIKYLAKPFPVEGLIRCVKEALS